MAFAGMPELLEDGQCVFEAEGHAFEDRPDNVRAGMIGRQAHQCRTGVGVQVRCSFPHEIRSPEHSSGPGRNLRCLCAQLVVRRGGRSEVVAKPTQGKAGRLGHSHHVPASGYGMAEGVQPSQRVGDRGVGSSKDHPRSTDGGAYIARTDNPHPGCACSLIARARHHRRAGLQAGAGGSRLGHMTDDLLRFMESRQAVGAEPNRIEHGIRPAAMRHIEQQGARGIRHVDRPHPGEAEADVIFGQQKAVKSPPDPGFVGPHPQQLGERKVGERGVGSQLHQALRPDGFVEIAALGRGALIAPDEGRAQNLIVAIQQHRAVHLAAKPDAGNLRGRDLRIREQFPNRGLAGLPPVVRILLCPPAAWRRKRLVFVDSGRDDRA